MPFEMDVVCDGKLEINPKKTKPFLDSPSEMVLASTTTTRSEWYAEWRKTKKKMMSLFQLDFIFTS